MDDNRRRIEEASKFVDTGQLVLVVNAAEEGRDTQKC